MVAGQGHISRSAAGFCSDDNRLDLCVAGTYMWSLEAVHTCFSALLLQVSEAEAMVAGGVADVFVSNEVVAAPKLQRLVALSAQGQYGAALWTGGL